MVAPVVECRQDDTSLRSFAFGSLLFCMVEAAAFAFAFALLEVFPGLDADADADSDAESEKLLSKSVSSLRAV